MASVNKLDPRGRIRTSSAVALTALLTAAASYCRAAEQDEDRGFTCTAAFEWRKAADLLAPVPTLADECWSQWERLMQLPRRLASPIDSANTTSSSYPAAFAQAA